MEDLNSLYADKGEFVEIRSVSFDAGNFKYSFKDHVDSSDFRGLMLTYSKADISQEICISNAHVLINLRDFINRMLETYAKK